MIEILYNVQFDRAVLNLENRILGAVQAAAQQNVDALVSNIKSKFDDQTLADSIEGHVEASGTGLAADEYAITGIITSTSPVMVWYERGRPPGGKMPPKDAIRGWAVRKGLQPDPERTAIAFAFAINASRKKKGKKPVPTDVLVEWQARSGIVASEEFAFDSMAYAIGLKIQREGIAGHHFFEQGLEESRGQFSQTFDQMIAQAL
jgi:hypothetical protein